MLVEIHELKSNREAESAKLAERAVGRERLCEHACCWGTAS
jgi:hypothetical protein